MFDIIDIAMSVIVGGICVVLFSFTAACTASILGDSTPKSTGKLTLNPLKHIEPFGFILYIFMGYGWTNVVETKSGNFKNRKYGTIITYSMPIVIGILLSIAVNVIAEQMGNTAAAEGADAISYALYLLPYKFSYLMLRLSIVNIIPVYPMFGSNVLKAFLSPNAAMAYTQRERILQIVIIFLILLGIGTTPIDFIINLLLG